MNDMKIQSTYVSSRYGVSRDAVGDLSRDVSSGCYCPLITSSREKILRTQARRL